MMDFKTNYQTFLAPHFRFKMLFKIPLNKLKYAN
jgi:hypothetical protein